MLMAKKLEDDLTLKDTICDQICTDLRHVTSEIHIKDCLPAEYKQQKKRRVMEQSTGGLSHCGSNVDNNVTEQKAMTVSTEGYEEPFNEADRGPNVKPASEVVVLLERYNSVLLDAIKEGQPVPVGLYIIAKPEMVFVPVRFTVWYFRFPISYPMGI
jgi:hypothetical protein